MPQGSNLQATAAAAAPVQQEAEQVDYRTWPVKELRRFLTERGEDPSGIVEKNDLVAKVGRSSCSHSDVLESGCIEQSGTSATFIEGARENMDVSEVDSA